jgi:hypothetical protein
VAEGHPSVPSSQQPFQFVFAFVPGQFGASEVTYALLAAAIGLSTAAGLSLALVRRLRGLLVAAGGVLALTIFGDR